MRCVIPRLCSVGLGRSEHQTSVSASASFLHQSANMITHTMTHKTPADLHRERFTFPLVHHHTDALTSLAMVTETVRTDHPVTSCWSQFQTDERSLFTQQPWDVNSHRYLNWMCGHSLIYRSWKCISHRRDTLWPAEGNRGLALQSCLQHWFFSEALQLLSSVSFESELLNCH